MVAFRNLKKIFQFQWRECQDCHLLFGGEPYSPKCLEAPNHCPRAALKELIKLDVFEEKRCLECKGWKYRDIYGRGICPTCHDVGITVSVSRNPPIIKIPVLSPDLQRSIARGLEKDCSDCNVGPYEEVSCIGFYCHKVIFWELAKRGILQISNPSSNQRP